MGSNPKRASPKPSAPLVGQAAQPRVLLVGGTVASNAALSEALERRGLASGYSTVDGVSAAVKKTAPDLVVLLDEAARDSGSEAIAELGRSPLTSVIPIAIVDEQTELAARLSAFRHGVCAVVRRQASMDGMADELAKVLREIPERSGQGLGAIGEVTLEEFVSTLAGQLRSGILSVRPRGAPAEGAVRLVLGAGRPVSEIIDEFVRRIRAHIVSAEPLEYEFDELAKGTVELLDGHHDAPPPEPPEVAALRVLLADDDAGRADAVAQELRSRGAFVVVSDLKPSPVRFRRLRELDPAVLLVGKDQLEGMGYELVQGLRSDLRLRWSSLLVVDWKEVWPEQSAALVIGELLAKLQVLAAPEKHLVGIARTGETFEARLETTGPARLVRALATIDSGTRIEVTNPRATVQLDLSKGLVVGASAELHEGGGSIVQGARALAALLALSSGRVRVERVEQPVSANLMTTPDVAFEMASIEPPPLAASIPPAAAASGAAAQPGRKTTRRRALWVGGAAVALVGAMAALYALRASDPAPSRPAPSVKLVGSAAKPSPAPVASLRVAAAMPSSGSPANASLCRDLVAAHPAENGQGIRGSEEREAFRAVMRGDARGAELWYCRALVRDPGDAQAVVGLVRLLLERNEGPTAAHWAAQGLAAHADNQRLRGLLGDALASSGNEAGARQAWLASAGLETQDAQGQRKLAERELAAAERAGHERRTPEAERLFRRAAMLAPDNLPAKLGLARTLLARGETQEAVAWANRATEAAPRNALAWVILGDALDRTGQQDQARQAWTRAGEIAPADPEVRHRLRR